MFVVVCYDIESDRLRNHVASVLEEAGVRVQKSVFECLLTDRELVELRRRLEEMLPAAEAGRPGDRIRFYPICPRCVSKARQKGGPEFYTEPLAYFA